MARGLGLPSGLNWESRMGKTITYALPVDQQRSAALIAADNSTCVDDCAELLEMLGIDLQEVWSKD
jgi:hypothetical protein